MKEFFKFVWVDIERFDEEPWWTTNFTFDGKNYITRPTRNEFYNSEEEAKERKEELEKHECVIIKGVFKTFFDDEFVARAEEYRKLINDSGMFSFNYRKKLREEMRQELIPELKADKSNRYEIFDKKAYLKQI